ncbi:MAG: DUF1428 domain-containing protein [Rhodobacterales bacterium]|nr:DUF1428 domain-containing protein [Rhodobacterales bacterium]
MAYVDVFVTPVRLPREAEYLDWVAVSQKMWTDHGALSYLETRAEDVPLGKVTSFPRALHLEPDEIIYLAFATYRDRAHRDAVNARIMADPRMKELALAGLADLKRMIFGGFSQVSPD